MNNNNSNTNDTIERLEEVEPLNLTPELEQEPGPGTQEQMMQDPKWNGIPPVGNRPIYNKWNFLLLVLLVFIVKIIIWSIYRFTTGTLDIFTNPESGREATYWAGIVAKPVLQLAPVFIIWIYVFKERGLPFRLTRKHLFSSIIFGCILGFIYYFVASYVMMGVFELSGHGTDFHFVAGWDDAGWWLIIAMMFSFMIGTGPTEEIFSRGFIQDQTARAFPLKYAILFTAILFAAGHLPISILVYRLSFMTIVWYMIILVVMSCFFSILYQWSRNIVFPAIIHGLWDWYLSLFALRGAYSAWFMTDPDVNFGVFDFVSTLITLAIMLPIFYIVYLVWWKHDKPLEHGPIANIIRAINNISITDKIRKLDQGNWPKANPILVTAAIVFVFCLAMYPVAALIGVDDPSKHVDRVMGGTTREKIIWNNESLTDADTASEGGNIYYSLHAFDEHIIAINITLTWVDEPPINSRYTNQPDTFNLVLNGIDESELDSVEGSTGNLQITWSGPADELINGTFSVTVHLVDAGDQEPMVNILDLRTQADTFNDYNISIEFIKYIRVKSSDDEADVRWEG